MKRMIALTLGVAVIAAVAAVEVRSEHLSAGTPDSAASAAESRRIKAHYEAAAKIASAVERDREYSMLAGFAAGAGDFELAMHITGRISSVAPRDNCYARIVFQAMRVGDVAAADGAAEKISSKMLRDEQFKKIGQSCPSNTTTEGAASIPGLDDETRTRPVQRSTLRR